jgi:hypothetical protein
MLLGFFGFIVILMILVFGKTCYKIMSYQCCSKKVDHNCTDHKDAVSGDYYDEIDIKILLSEYKRACLEIKNTK